MNSTFGRDFSSAAANTDFDPTDCDDAFSVPSTEDTFEAASIAYAQLQQCAEGAEHTEFEQIRLDAKRQVLRDTLQNLFPLNTDDGTENISSTDRPVVTSISTLPIRIEIGLTNLNKSKNLLAALMKAPPFHGTQVNIVEENDDDNEYDNDGFDVDEEQAKEKRRSLLMSFLRKEPSTSPSQ